MPSLCLHTAVSSVYVSLKFPTTDPPVDGRDAGANVPGNVLGTLAVQPQPDNPHAVDLSRGRLGGSHDVPVWWGRATQDQKPSSAWC